MAGNPGETRLDPLQQLLIECLDRLEHEGSAALDALCEQNPQHATALRRRLDRLQALGLLHEDSSRDAVPERLGEFRLERLLGGGGMGVVYLAIQEPLGREVALKLVRPEQLYFPGTRERFRREVEAIARLQHPGIVPVYTIGDEGDVPYFAMERVRGATLQELLDDLDETEPAKLSGADMARVLLARAGEPDSTARDSAFGYVFGGSWEEACLRIVRQVADALEHAHRRGILHRDVKPSNVMVTPSGRAMLLDFGLASTEGTSRLTRTGSQLGSLQYMSPEQARGDLAAIDRRSDVYSLGATLYELLCLAPVVSGDSTHAVLERIEAGSPVPLRRRNAAISWEAETVCHTAIESDPARRYASAADFARDLTNALEGRPIEARRAGFLLRARRWTARHKAASVAIALGATLVVGGPTALWVQERSARERIQHESELAEQNFQSALLAVDRMLTRVGDITLRDVPQMEGVRRALLQDAVEFHETLLARKSDDPGVQLENALVWRRLGGLYAELLEVDRSVAAFARSGELLGALRAAAPDDARTTLEDLTTRKEWADMLLLNGRADEARSMMLGVIAAAEPRLATGDDGSFAKVLAKAYHGLGTIEEQRGDFGAAEEALARGVALLEGLVAAQPDNAPLLANLANTVGQLGLTRLRRLRVEEGDPASVETPLRRAVDVFRTMAEERPADPTLAFQLAQAQNNLAGAYRNAFRPDDALVLYEQAVQRLEDLVARFPDTFAYRSVLAASLHNSALALEEAERPAEALAPRRAAIVELESLVARSPNAADLHGRLGIALRTHAMIEQPSDPAAARAGLEKAHFHTAEAMRLDPRNVNFPQDQFLNVTALFRAELGARDFDAATRWFDKIPALPSGPLESWERHTQAAACASLALRTLKGMPELDAAERAERELAFARRGVESLRAAIAGGFADFDELLQAPPIADLRATEEFEELRKEIGLGR